MIFYIPKETFAVSFPMSFLYNKQINEMHDQLDLVSLTISSFVYEIATAMKKHVSGLLSAVTA